MSKLVKIFAPNSQRVIRYGVHTSCTARYTYDSFTVGDSIIRNVGTGRNNTKAECFPGIVRTEQLHRVLDNRDLGTPDSYNSRRLK
jgi:hypothetical protein